MFIRRFLRSLFTPTCSRQLVEHQVQGGDMPSYALCVHVFFRGAVRTFLGMQVRDVYLGCVCIFICTFTSSKNLLQDLRQQSDTHIFFHIFHLFHSTPLAVTHKKDFQPQNAPFFHLGRKWGVVSGGPREGPNRARFSETTCLRFCMSIRASTLGECLKRQGFLTWITLVIYAAAAVACDESPGQQCTEIMSYHKTLMCVFARLTLVGYQIW